MESNLAVQRLSALAQPNRLAVFRCLIRCGPAGLPAGDIARLLDVAPNTLSAQLTLLAQAGLLTRRRDGRSIVYAANQDAMSDLIVYLLEDCCAGRPDICAPIADAVARAACC
ncbi:ArsR/SmtB family transcription factor [Hyphomonas johnsonii]|uniref:ArsR family transcriptional regulator n=1 Tax=Hyphomonas johnsonii MHS-2 TaxID=1280950 RepID=A0A059F992_9PROT|nr:metalloregulator ArsR/SmtB family transcription factor [Hyphomonas johnsonii]KCZ87126.1 ArsR family transcriptional regulator [Hyphomonas johnsonii MHS-2]